MALQKEFGFRFVHASSSEVYGDFDGLMEEDVLENASCRLGERQRMVSK